jgi:Tol biopolymer transport system component
MNGRWPGSLCALAVCVLGNATFAEEIPIPISLKFPAADTPDSAGGDSYVQSVTPDGRYVLLGSTALNLLESNGHGLRGVVPLPVNAFLRDRHSGTNALVSMAYRGDGGANADCFPISISTNARFALLESTASNLCPGDTNGVADVFVRDLLNGVTLLVSAGTNGLPGNRRSYSASMTPGGRYVAFVSDATDLVAGDTNRMSDVFVRDLESGVTVLASVGAMPAYPPNGGRSGRPLLTPDGHFVAFWSTATNLVQEFVPTRGLGGPLADVYVRDLVDGTTTWASRRARDFLLSNFGVTNSFSYNHNLSADGRYVAFQVTPWKRLKGLILRCHLPTGETELVETNAAVQTAHLDNISDLAMTPDGRLLAYVANADFPSTNTSCVVVWDAVTKARTIVSVDRQGAVPDGTISDSPALDPAGRYLAFVSNAAGLATNEVPVGFNLYWRDLAQEQTLHVNSAAPGMTAAAALVPGPAILAQSGTLVFFQAADSPMVVGDDNTFYDAFARQMPDGNAELISRRLPTLASSTANGSSSLTESPISADGTLVAFWSYAEDLVPGDTNGCPDVFVRDTQAGTNLLVSANTNGAPANGTSTEPSISADGRYVVFTSAANDLVPADTNGFSDVYLRDLQAGTTLLVSRAQSVGESANAPSFAPVISLNGSAVLFRSYATNLTAGAFSPGAVNLFYYDLSPGTNYLVGRLGRFPVTAMTPDGRLVAYTENLDNFVWDRQTLARSFTNDSEARGIEFSRDGRWLASFSSKTRLIEVRDLSGGPERTLQGVTFAPAVNLHFSADARFLTFCACPSIGSHSQIYLYDTEAGTNYLVSHAWNSSAPGNDESDSPAISPDGRLIAFRSFAPNLVVGDTNNVKDLFVFDRLQGSLLVIGRGSDGEATLDGHSCAPRFSGDGGTLTFNTRASNLIAEDFNHAGDIFFAKFTSGPLLVVVITLSSDPRQCLLTWPVMAGKTYRLQYKEDLHDGVWLDSQCPVTVEGNQASANEDLVAGKPRFYRVSAE